MPVAFAYITGILSNTPLWVYALLGLLIWLGLLGLKPRTVTIGRIAIVPVAFIIWGLTGLANKPFLADVVAALWVAGLFAGAIVGIFTGPRLCGADRARRQVRMPRSWWPLLRNLISSSPIMR